MCPFHQLPKEKEDKLLVLGATKAARLCAESLCGDKVQCTLPCLTRNAESVVLPAHQSAPSRPPRIAGRLWTTVCSRQGSLLYQSDCVNILAQSCSFQLKDLSKFRAFENRQNVSGLRFCQTQGSRLPFLAWSIQNPKQQTCSSRMHGFDRFPTQLSPRKFMTRRNLLFKTKRKIFLLALARVFAENDGGERTTTLRFASKCSSCGVIHAQTKNDK